MKIPTLSAPLVKDIRTGEGVAEWLLGLGVTVLTAVGDLGVAKGATFLTILAGVKGIRRGLIKIVGLQGDFVGPPLEPHWLTGTVEPIGEKIAAGVGTVASAVAPVAGGSEPPAA